MEQSGGSPKSIEGESGLLYPAASMLASGPLGLAAEASGADGANLAGGGKVLSDAMAERLMRSLERLEEDYAQTLAAGVREDAADNACGITKAIVDAGNHHEEPAAARCDDNDAASSLQDEEDSTNGNAYMAIGSDDDGSDGGLDVEMRFDHQTEAANVGWPANVEGESSVWPQPIEQEDFEDFQCGDYMENFADFGKSNTLLPPPPSGLSQLEVTPFTDQEIRLIKDTMKQVQITPPPWAQNLRNTDFRRMVKEALAAA